jgi:hypothetical protein
MNARIGGVNVAPNYHEPLQFLVLGEIEARRKAAKDHAEREDVGQGIVVADRQFPRGVVGIIGWVFRNLPAGRDEAVVDAPMIFCLVDIKLGCHIDPGRLGLLDVMDGIECLHHVFIFNEWHLQKVLAEYVGYLNPASQHPFIYVVEEKRFC